MAVVHGLKPILVLSSSIRWNAIVRARHGMDLVEAGVSHPAAIRWSIKSLTLSGHACRCMVKTVSTNMAQAGSVDGCSTSDKWAIVLMPGACA